MKRNDCIFDILKQAKENNGIVTIYNYNENEKIKTATDAKNLLEAFFHYHISLSWLIFDVYVSRSDNITKKQRDALKRLNVEYKNHGISFNAYDLFHIPSNKRTVDAFDFYINFFSICKEHILKYRTEERIQFVNEYSPLRVEVNVKDNQKLQDKLHNIVNSEEGKDWFYSLAKGLSSIGRWSWFYIAEKGLLDFEEDYDFQQVKYQKFKDKKEAEKK